MLSNSSKAFKHVEVQTGVRVVLLDQDFLDRLHHVFEIILKPVGTGQIF